MPMQGLFIKKFTYILQTGYVRVVMERSASGT